MDTQTSETRESDDYYGNLKNLHGSQIIQQALGDQKLLPALWLNDKSDLDSLDSDYFKNSLHQLDGRSSQSPHRERVIIETNGNCGGQHKSEIIIETNYSNDNVSIRSDGPENCIPDYCTIRSDEVHVIDNYASAENVSVLHGECQLNGNHSYAVNSGTLTICHDNNNRRGSESDEDGGNGGGDRSGDNGDANDRKIKFKEDHRSVISYDSIYLSSEGSNEATTLNEEEEKINEYLSDNNYSTLSEYTNIKRDHSSAAPVSLGGSHQNGIDKSDLDLYSQIHKSKPKIVQVEAKTKLTTFSDISSRGTLERLTFVSSPAPTQAHKEHSHSVKPEKLQHSRESAIDNQYCSLPLANIGKSLQASERIDARLRQSCIPFEEQSQIYDSITNFGRAHKKLRQRESYDTVILSPTPPEEKPKELPSIDVKPPIKEVTPDCSKYGTIETPTKLLKIDEETSLISAELTDIENCSSKDCQIDEIRQKPEKIKLTAKPKGHATTKVTTADIHDSRDNIIEETIDVPVVKINANPVRQKSYQKSHHSKRQQTGNGKGASEHKERSSGNSKNNSSNTLKRRIENKTKHNLNEKPISKFVRNIDKSKNNKNAKVQQAILANINTIAQPNFNMSRPQILNVIDSKRQPRTSSTSNRHKIKDPEIENASSEATAQAHKEFQHKVDSVRNYWSKLIDDTDDGKDNEKYTFAGGIGTEVPKTLALSQRANKMAKPKPTAAIVDTPDEIEVRPATITASDNTLKRGATASTSMRSLLRTNERDELNSFTPSVEIVELDDQKQAAIVKAQDIGAQDFDHVRYKVMKSDTFQKNILAPSRKEAQFDGLLQYLNEYSFQVSFTSSPTVLLPLSLTSILICAGIANAK